MTAPDRLLALIDTFDRNKAEYLGPHYKEAQVRQEFLDPCFQLLGWDTDNEAGLAPSEREVVHEDSLRIGSGMKAPDYSFRINGNRKFFVEAKRPSVKIASEREPAYQLRRYAWSANLPISIVTDFQEWAIYDCRKRPSLSDTPAIARYAFIRYDELAERWDELTSLISKEAVVSGSLERFASSVTRARQMAEVDDAFLGEIESWRRILAEDMAERNKTLDVDTLSSAVQTLIDRIVFLRISEARGIEDLGQLRDIASGPKVYEELLNVFSRADARYNSGLFHFENEHGRGAPDELAHTLKLGDEPLKRIISRLYYPESPYEFSVLPGRILGQAYERFLGSEITISPEREVNIELKAEARRAGGIYYTPGYIADRIVIRTIGEMLDASSRTGRADASKLRIVDPACGSGSFLLSAYDYLLNWHLDYYVSRGPSKFKKELHQLPNGEWRLTIAERKRILMQSIFGVDVDPQAVETTKLSLLLKVLEGESAETLGQSLALFHVRALPDLDNNIKCGNSLLDQDVLARFPDELGSESSAQSRLKPFNWRDAFPQAFKRDNPGFDVVLGNPPYVSALTMVDALDPKIKDYWKKRYQSASGAYDLYVIFVEQGLRICRQGGRLSYIIPSKFLAAEYAIQFRKMIYDDNRFVELVDYSRTRVWRKGVYPVVPLIIRSKPKNADDLTVSVGDPEVKTTVHPVASVPRSILGGMPDHLWSFVTQEGVSTLDRIIKNSKALESFGEITGSSTVAEGSEFPAVLSSLDVGQRVPDNASKFLVTGSIIQFGQRWATREISYMHKSYFRPILMQEDPVPVRRRNQARSRKLIIAKVSMAPKAVADYKGEFAAAYCTYIVPREDVSIAALTGVINSDVVGFAARLMYGALGMSGGYITFQPPQMRRLPICDLSDSEKVNRLEVIVKKIEELSYNLLEVQSPGEHRRLRSELTAAQAQLNDVVAELYGLSQQDRDVIGDFMAKETNHLIEQEPDVETASA